MRSKCDRREAPNHSRHCVANGGQPQAPAKPVQPGASRYAGFARLANTRLAVKPGLLKQAGFEVTFLPAWQSRASG